MPETERLILRPFTKDDTEAVYAMRSDAGIMRFIREPQKTLTETENWIRLVSSRWQDEKIGFCAVIEKSSGKLIGWCGLWRLKETGEIEIGYAISAEYQGLGLATEAAQVFLKYGFEEINAEKIVAVAHPDNKSSRRVMEKLGMKFEKIGKFYGTNLAYYSIEKADRRQNGNR